MEIVKVVLEDEGKSAFETLMRDDSEGKPVRIRYSVEDLNGDRMLKFDAGKVLAYSVLLDGSVSYICNDDAPCQVAAGESFYCELEDKMEVHGRGKVLTMMMDNGIRGAIRILPVEKEKTIKAGEAIGESCMMLLGLDGAFTLENEGQLFECEKGNAIVLRTGKRDFAKVRFLCRERVHVAMLTGVKMFDSDFSRHIGVHIIEQGYGRCKVRLDIRREHMNPIGSVHGGCLFTMADEAAGISASSTGGVCTTVDSHIEFLNASLHPKYLTAEAKPKKIGKKIRTFNVEIRDEKDVLISSAEFIFYCLQN